MEGPKPSSLFNLINTGQPPTKGLFKWCFHKNEMPQLGFAAIYFQGNDGGFLIIPINIVL